MASLLSFLSSSENRELMDDLNYLNLEEIRGFCDKHEVPYAICVEGSDGKWRKTRNHDRKGVILERIREYLKTGKIPAPTRIPATIVSDASPPSSLSPNDRLFYGQYDKKSEAMVELLKSLTGGRFKSGAIARIVAREFWSRGVAPTYHDYAMAWLEATESHTRPRPEWAFLSDRADRTATSAWKELRKRKAKRVLSVLGRIGVRKGSNDG